MKINKKEKLAIKGTITFMIYVFILMFNTLPFEILGIDVNSLPSFMKSIYTILIELIIVIIAFILYKDYIIKSFKDFKKNKNIYLKKYLKYWFVILIGTIIVNGIILLINGRNMSGNEENVRNLLLESPLYTWILSVLIAPVLEELIFRLSLKFVFNNKWIFIIMSGLIFGSFHLIGNTNSWMDALYIIPYSFPGMIFAYVLYKSDNIFTTIGLHMLHNGVLISLQLILILFGATIV